MTFTRRQLDTSARRQIGSNFGIAVVTRSAAYEALNQVLSDWCRETKAYWKQNPVDTVAGGFQYAWPDDLVEVKEAYYSPSNDPNSDVKLRYVPYERLSRHYQGGTPGIPEVWTVRGAMGRAAAAPEVGSLLIAPFPSNAVTGGLKLVGPSLFARQDESSTEQPFSAGSAAEGVTELATNDAPLPFPESHRQGILMGLAYKYAVLDAANPESNSRIPFLRDEWESEREKVKELVQDPGDDPLVIGGDYLRGWTSEEDAMLPSGFSRFPYRG